MGTRTGEVTLGGRRVEVERPRVRAPTASAEVPLADLRALRRPRPAGAGRDGADAGRRLDAPVPAHAGAGRRARSSRRAVDVEVLGVARRSSSARRRALGELMSRRLDDVRLAVMMIDGLELKGRTTSSRWGSRPRASRSRSGCGKARPRTRPSRRRCSPISSTAAWTPSRGCCS